MNVLDNIKAIVFDAYGTLIDINSLDHRLEHYYASQARALSTIWRRKQLEYTWLRSLMSRYQPFSQVTMDALTFACAHLNLSLSNEIKQDLKERYFSLSVYPEVPQVLQNLASKYSLAILSNANQEMLKKAAHHSDIHPYLDHIFSADSIKKYKPTPEVYQLAEQGLQLPKEQIAFVSSNTWDVSGAKSYGFKVIWLNRTGQIEEVLGFTADLVIKELEELTA